ncbi:MAG TPA: 16S rRNA (adenine(1518)-N(6)/adenine(1519)-N(6))-dimethyltransferase RsmA [Candidatus Ornithomonoglobus merdipullorum]|uniref:Ribosomal RNA small subunit methyltransferase A n=1 Tax=Candidatus Ornithomonoglobus merdipullorum TaxID=2840895 RepID=A0A9D1SER9_9FIRM|nr:16S rRNA (adenine(1518)-N(6)/adenine(1519)-N(6))-dimethyltransferase RsmA [Candidatus Ornithomonoglobus merdipullorum]
MYLASPTVIKNIAAKYGFTFKKGLGQNFLTSKEILERIAESAEIEYGAIEIGPGFGVLTDELAERAEKVVALEIDERLIPVLKDTMSDHDNIKVINADVMKTDMAKLIEEEFGEKPVSIAANLPYYITTPIITMLLESRLPVKNIVVMVQKEVAERISAAPGSKDYGALTVMCRYFTRPELVCVVPASLFVPQPKVDSAVLRLRVLDKPSVEVSDEKLFFRTVKAAFSQRRKTLLNCLAANFPHGKAALTDILESLGIDPRRRGETLSIAEFAELSEKLR